MSTSVTATTQPSPYVPPAGAAPSQAVQDQKTSDLTQLAVQADRTAKAQGTGVTLDILA